MIDEVLVRIFTSEWRVFLIISLLLLALAQAGFHLAKRRHRETTEGHKNQITSIQTAVLGLLALLLGFTFAMALGRYESRRNLVLQEANAIGTTYLRASFLPGTHKSAVEDLLRRYIEVRIPLYDRDTSTVQLRSLEQQSAKLQHELWEHLVAAAKESPSVVIATFIGSLNETIDLDAARLHALRSHVPGAAWLLVLFVAGVGCYMTGYAAGISKTQSAFSTVLLPLLVAIVVTLISDLDAPRQGLIGISKKPLLDLKQSLESQ
jgi:drug/metabolite transporter (DMT)-like permease